MKQPVAVFLPYMLALALMSCATTDDPRQGGLFGYNPDAYERRLSERRANLEALQKEQSLERNRTEQLKQELSQKESERDTQAVKLAQMDQQVAAIEGKLRQSKLKTTAQGNKVAAINGELQKVKQGVNAARSGNFSADEADKQKEIERLNAEIDRLMREADALSGM